MKNLGLIATALIIFCSSHSLAEENSQVEKQEKMSVEEIEDIRPECSRINEQIAALEYAWLT